MEEWKEYKLNTVSSRVEKVWKMNLSRCSQRFGTREYQILVGLSLEKMAKSLESLA